VSEYISGGYAEPPPANSGIPKWLIIGGIALVLLCGLGGAVFCLGPIIGLTLAGPAIGGEFEVILLQLDCTSENPSLSEEECQSWAEGVANDYPGAYTDCSQSYDEATDRYQCILDAGVDPP
jgi:hypothetical protein